MINESIQLSLDITDADANKVRQNLQKEANHGYISAEILCRTIMEFFSRNQLYGEIKNSSNYKALLLAIGAIALHSLEKVKGFCSEEYVKKINFDSNPYAYLLFLIDNIQDWNRTIVPHPLYPRCDLLNISIENASFRLEYVLRHKDWTADIKKNVKDYIGRKDYLLSLLQKPSLSLGIDVLITFETNESKGLGNIKIIL